LPSLPIRYEFVLPVSHWTRIQPSSPSSPITVPVLGKGPSYVTQQPISMCTGSVGRPVLGKGPSYVIQQPISIYRVPVMVFHYTHFGLYSTLRSLCTNCIDYAINTIIVNIKGIIIITVINTLVQSMYAQVIYVRMTTRMPRGLC